MVKQFFFCFLSYDRVLLLGIIFFFYIYLISAHYKRCSIIIITSVFKHYSTHCQDLHVRRWGKKILSESCYSSVSLLWDCGIMSTPCCSWFDNYLNGNRIKIDEYRKNTGKTNSETDKMLKTGDWIIIGAHNTSVQRKHTFDRKTLRCFIAGQTKCRYKI